MTTIRFSGAATVPMLLTLALSLIPAVSLQAQDAAPPSSSSSAPSSALPALPEGVTHLEFSEFFVRPVGPWGLELTPKLKALDGKQVRVYGYMVQQENRVPETLLLTAQPVIIEEHEGGFSDLPPAYVRVQVPAAKGKVIPYTHRPLLLTGTLSVGNHPEGSDGTVSLVRLTLDETAPAPTL